MKKNLLKKIGISVGLGLMILPFTALAATEFITSPSQIAIIISTTLDWMFRIIFGISTIMLLWAAILYLTAGTSEKGHEKAKNVLIYAIIGIAVAILAVSVKPFLESVFRGTF